MTFFLFLFFLSFILLVGRYYSRVMTRVFSFFFPVDSKKWSYAITFLAYFLGFCTINVFSSLGIFLLHFLLFSFLFEGMFWILKKHVSFSHFLEILSRFSVLPLLLTCIFFLYGFFNIRHIVETSYEISTNKAISDSLKILFLSDSHYGTVLKKDDLEELKSRVGEDLDLVLLGGDIVDENTTKDEMKEIFGELGDIKSKYGTYFVFGNHDRQKYSRNKDFSVEELTRVLGDFSITPLCDEVEFLRDDIVLIGREDVGEKRKTARALLQDIDSSKFVILLDHQPVSYLENEKLGVDLMLSGHTHAGQIFPAGYFIKWFHMADLWYGHETFGGMDAVVSSGLAGWGYPIRTQEHSEYVIVNVRKA